MLIVEKPLSKKAFPIIILAGFAVFFVISTAYLSKKAANLEFQLIQKTADADSLRMIGSTTAQKLANIASSEKDIRLITERELALKKGELAGWIRAYTDLEIQFGDLRDTLITDSPEAIDTTGETAAITYTERKEFKPGYTIGFKPTLSLPKPLVIYADDFSIVASIHVKFQPFFIRLALTEDKKGQWETTVTTDSPLFQSYGRMNTIVNPYRLAFWDKLKVGAGVGITLPIGLYGKVGAGYNQWAAHLVAGSEFVGLEFSCLTPVSSIWR